MAETILTTSARPILRWSRATPNAIAVIEKGTSYSYATLTRNVAQATRTLAAAGLCPGMIMGIDCGVQYLHLVLILACEVSGAAHVMIEPSDRALDSDLLPRCDLLCVETVGDLASRHPRVIELSPQFVHTMLLQPIDDGDLALLATAYPSNDLVRIGKTSGTTGRPKFMGYTRQAVRSTVELVPRLLNSDYTRLNFISVYPFLMTRTYSDSMSALEFGATVIYSDGAELAANIRSLAQCHTFLLVGNAVLLPPSEQFQDGPINSCTLFVGGGFVPPRLRAALCGSVTADVRVAYSTNETRDISVAETDGASTILPDVAVKIIDESGNETAPDKPGRVVVRTPRMATSYLWNDTETAAHFRDGWFLTSDIGYMPVPNKLLLLGRADDMVNLGGVKFAPYPSEERIRAIDGVSDVAIIGWENAAGSGELHVFIERNDPTADQHIRNQVTEVMVGQVALYHIHYLDLLPRTATGKVQRRELRQLLSTDSTLTRTT